jgi:hypothetical protein
MNRKEIFEKVKTHLLTQKEWSRGSRGCMYRGPNGLKCAIGALITDECYNTELEGRSADAYEVVEALKCSGIEVGPGDTHFLCQLQGIHDANSPDRWPGILNDIAKEYDL